MRKYTKSEIFDAIREELIFANKSLGISASFTDDDYKYLGVVSSAIDRIQSNHVKSEDCPEFFTAISSISEGDLAKIDSNIKNFYMNHIIINQRKIVEDELPYEDLKVRVYEKDIELQCNRDVVHIHKSKLPELVMFLKNNGCKFINA